MCWITKNKPIKQIAEKDISVFKIAIHDGTDIFSVYRYFKYEKETTYSTKIDEVYGSSSKMYAIHKGFHSYSNDCELIMESNRIWVNDIKGYYLDDYSESEHITIIDGNEYVSEYVSKYIPNLKYIRLKCIIPKGSEYYLNERGEYVSNQIKIIDYYVLENKL